MSIMEESMQSRRNHKYIEVDDFQSMPMGEYQRQLLLQQQEDKAGGTGTSAMHGKTHYDDTTWNDLIKVPGHHPNASKFVSDDESTPDGKSNECYLEAPVVLTNNKSTFAPTEKHSLSSQVQSESGRSI